MVLWFSGVERKKFFFYFSGKDNNKKTKKDVKEAKKKSELKKSAVPIKVIFMQYLNILNFTFHIWIRKVENYLNLEEIIPANFSLNRFVFVTFKMLLSLNL